MRLLIIFTIIFSIANGSHGFSYCSSYDQLETLWPDWNNIYIFIQCTGINSFQRMPCPGNLYFGFWQQVCVWPYQWEAPPGPDDILGSLTTSTRITNPTTQTQSTPTFLPDPESPPDSTVTQPRETTTSTLTQDPDSTVTTDETTLEVTTTETSTETTTLYTPPTRESDNPETTNAPITPPSNLVTTTSGLTTTQTNGGGTTNQGSTVTTQSTGTVPQTTTEDFTGSTIPEIPPTASVDNHMMKFIAKNKPLPLLFAEK